MLQGQAEQLIGNQSVMDSDMEASAWADTVRIVSRRMVQPSYGVMPMPSPDDIQLTPWDLRCITVPYIQRGILLPKPPAGVEVSLVDTLASSLSRALGRYYHLAGRLTIEEHGDGTASIALRCTGEGAELVHAVARPGVVVAHIIGGSGYTTLSVVRAFFPLNGVTGECAIDQSLPVLGAQVTELSDGVFIVMSMNHAVGDGTCFWEMFNAWSAINRGEELTNTPVPVPHRWFIDTSSVPIHLPLSTLQHVMVGRFEMYPVRVAFFTFSATSVKKLKAKATDEMLKAKAKDEILEGSISFLQALIAHLWRAVSRARRFLPNQETSCTLMLGCRGRIHGIPPVGYLGNATVPGRATGCTVGQILDKGLGWTAWQLKRVVESFDEEGVRGMLDRWGREPTFFSLKDYRGGDDALGIAIASSPRFDVFGNDFGWGKPVVVRSSPGEKPDGIMSVFEGPGKERSLSLEVSLAPETMERFLADHEFMQAVMVPT